MLKYMLLFIGLLCGKPTIAAPVLTVDNPVQHVVAGESAVFYGSVVFDAAMPFGAEPALAPPVPATFSFSPALALAGSFGAGEIYSGPLLLIDVPHGAMPQAYSAMLTVGGSSNAVAVALNINAVPEPATFGLTAGVLLSVVLRRAKKHP